MTRPALFLLAAALLSGCANVHHIDVGSVPDDYRTRHPIVVAEGETVVELPVTSSETALVASDVSRVQAFARAFRASDASAIRILMPVGSFNAPAARLVTDDALKVLTKAGVPRGRVLVSPYPADGVDGPVPVRMSFSVLQAKVAPCGRWPEDLGNTHENKNYFNFGCASQANLAAQIADPRDLLSPRGMSETDAERRTTAIADYRRGEATASEPSRTESDYDW